MHRNLRPSAAVAAALLGLSALNLAAAEPDQRLYAHCSGPEEKAHTSGVHETPQLLPDVPGSIEAGNGCGQFDLWAGMNPEANDEDIKSMSWHGTFEGDISSLTVEGWLMTPGPEHVGQSLIIPARVFIDDWSVLPADGDAIVPGLMMIEVTPEVSSTPGFSKVLFSVEGIAPELGATGETHDIWIHLETPGVAPQPGGWPVSYAPSTPQAWVWGVAEAPSGVTFNPSELAAVVLEAPAPA